MPKLLLVARNISGAPSPFVLDAFTAEPTEESIIVTPNEDQTADPNHCMRLNYDREVGPGERIKIEGDVEVNYDFLKLHWRTPREIRQRFQLEHFTFGEHALIKAGGWI